DAAGFTPDDLQGWFSDEHIWSLAAEIGRIAFLSRVVIRHEQTGLDETYADAMRTRERLGGLDNMRRQFYSIPKVQRRDALVAKLEEAKASTVRVSVPGPPQWEKDALENARQAREHARLIREETLVAVGCYQGDVDLVKMTLPVHLAHNGHVVLLSPVDSPVKMRRKGVECHSAGPRGYFGQVSLDRYRAQLEFLLGKY